MANYYNLTGWKRTGYDFFNRPESPEVLNREEFRDGMIRVDGILANRDDMAAITSIKIQGSVKDSRGTQINPPNSTGAHGHAPYYSLEEIDYIRLVRTGYPGDDDFVDISSDPDNPQDVSHDGAKLYIAYYFVTGLEPIARNVTRMYLSIDYWLTCGGKNELIIESGHKIGGMVTDTEDASSYNLSPVPIGLLEPLEVTSHAVIDAGWSASGNYNIITSAADLSQYEPGTNVDALVALASTGQAVSFPKIQTTQHESRITLITPSASGDETGEISIHDYGFYNADNARVQHGLSVLYSAGQLELQDSYSIPRAFLSASESASGVINDMRNVVKTIACPVSPAIGAYPRKADYINAQYVLYSLASGNMDIENVWDISDPTIMSWAIPTPTGSPIARFKGIKGHPYSYDRTVTGMPWLKKSVVMQGASGSLWNQISFNFAQQSNQIATARESNANKAWNASYDLRTTKTLSDIGFSAAKTVSSLGSVQNLLQGGKDTINAMQSAVNAGLQVAEQQTEWFAEKADRELRAQSLRQSQNQQVANYVQSEIKSPYIQFVPDLSVAMFKPNTFGVYIVNATAKDRERLRNYFLRYGYSGLYKPLTKPEIFVKQNVNYIVAEGVTLRHTYYPMRIVNGAAQVLQDGLHLWACRPSMDAFKNNPDREES